MASTPKTLAVLQAESLNDKMGKHELKETVRSQFASSHCCFKLAGHG